MWSKSSMLLGMMAVSLLSATCHPRRAVSPPPETAPSEAAPVQEARPDLDSTAAEAVRDAGEAIAPPPDGASSIEVGSNGGETLWVNAFAAYPGAERICAKHSSSADRSSIDDVYATKDSLDAVVAFYARRNGTPEADNRWNEDDGPTRATLHVLSGKAAAKGRVCVREKAPAGATIIVVSSETSAPLAPDEIW